MCLPNVFAGGMFTAAVTYMPDPFVLPSTKKKDKKVCEGYG